jgi:hypothetical protein
MLLHEDMGAFYTSIEQRHTPQYRGRPIAAATRALWSRAAFKQPMRLLSVGVTNLVDIEEHQLKLVGSVPGKLQGELNDVLDRITHRFGTEAIGRGHRRSVERAGLTPQDQRGEK